MFKPLLFFMAPAVLALMYGGVTSSFDPQRRANTAAVQQAFQQQTRLTAETTRTESQSALAQFRLQSGRCLKSPSLIQAGATYQAADGSPLPDGTYIADESGMTAEISGGKAIQLAATGNAAVVQEWLNGNAQ